MYNATQPSGERETTVAIQKYFAEPAVVSPLTRGVCSRRLEGSLCHYNLDIKITTTLFGEKYYYPPSW